jgi:proteasome alpha subunit
MPSGARGSGHSNSMSFTPYDWNQSIQTRMEYIEERLRDGSPVVGISIPEGVLLLSVHRAQRKVYEIYDRLIFGGIGNQSDIEAMRNASIDFAHREGFERSPDDVTVQRLVGSILAPALKRAFGDPFTAPFVFRGLFAELGDITEQDSFFALGFDGEYKNDPRYSVVAGSLEAENRIIDLLHGSIDRAQDRSSAIRLALEAWATGKLHARRAGFGRAGEDEEEAEVPSLDQILREEITEGTVEVGLLERNSPRESKFRLLRADELGPVLSEYR